MNTILVCKWCDQPVSWSRILDTTWCSDCRCDDVKEIEDEEAEVSGSLEE